MVTTINEPVLRETWSVLGDHFSIHNKHDHEQAIVVLNQLLDKVGDNEKHPLYGFLEILGIVIENYEAEHHQWDEASGVNVLQYLMQEHDLNQEDLSEIGSQGVVSEILNGKRQLNVNQIKKLGERFHVSPAVFL
jgi:HTH-type transcriptional regulator/antitoxin HigA